MDLVLRPGMRVMRRLGVAGKLGTIALVLLVPLSISIVGGYVGTRGQITATELERDGLALTQPLIHLLTEIETERNAVLEGEVPSVVRLTSLHDAGAATARYGSQFAVDSQWRLLRGRLSQLATWHPTDTPADQERALAIISGALDDARGMIAQVAQASHLILDPDLDSYSVMIVLTERLPRLIHAASSAQQYRLHSSSPTDLDVSIRELTTATSQLVTDLETAQTATTWNELGVRVEARTAALTAAVQTQIHRLESGTGTAGDTERVADTVAALADSLAESLDELLIQRLNRLRLAQLWPPLVSLAALVAAGYLFAAAFRSATQDVRTVLKEITTVTSGSVDSTQPLPGSDEFAQMSQALVYARDRLVALLGELRYQATHDDLTALGSRQLFMAKLEDALSSGTAPFAVTLLDLDGFKDLNDSFGHSTGDRLLRVVGARLHRAARRRDVVARLGGDEFAVLLKDVRDEQHAMALVQQIQAALEQPVELDGRPLPVRASVGVALGHPGSSSAVELVRNADVAMYAAKEAGKGRAAVFEPHMHDRTRERTELSTELAQGIERGELRLVYQPIVDLQSGRMHGVEALVRWHHPSRGPIAPDIFVPIAEAAGLIRPLGRWVLEEAVPQLARWRAEFPDSKPLCMDVNLSAPQLDDEGLVGEILTLIGSSGIDPTSLVLEITESALMDDIETARRRLAQLSALGVQLALDDFGTGYSSLSYLRLLPITVLKIDKSFAEGVEKADGEPGAVMRSIVSLAASLGMQAVAEGIETDRQAEALRAMGCHLGQGYLYSRPLTAEELSAALHRERAGIPQRAGVGGPASAADRVAPLPRPRT